ncbi:MAG: hypothetical protein HS128_08945 [Ideonella sp.]|nr:hypothetical protein [Ideonella sp.]
MFEKALIANRGDNAAGVAAQGDFAPAKSAAASALAREAGGRSSRAAMFEKVLIANRGDNAAGVAAQG